MMLYEITSDNGTGYAKYARRERENAARLMLEKFVYDACEAQGLRDRPMAHEQMARAKRWAKNTVALSISIGTYTVTINAERL